MTTELTHRDIWLAWHIRQAEKARLALCFAANDGERVALLATIDSHRAAINALGEIKGARNEKREHI